MNQVHSELQLARSLIDEKDSEIQRIRVSNNQVFSQVTIKRFSLARGSCLFYLYRLPNCSCLITNMLDAVY
jgi:hypothetical protein